MREAADLFEVARPVRIAAGVADVHEPLVREQVDHGTRDGETTEPGVEHPDGACVGHPPTRLGDGRTRTSDSERTGVLRDAARSPTSYWVP